MIIEYKNATTGKTYRAVMGRSDRKPVTDGVRFVMLTTHVQNLLRDPKSNPEQAYWAAREVGRRAIGSS